MEDEGQAAPVNLNSPEEKRRSAQASLVCVSVCVCGRQAGRQAGRARVVTVFAELRLFM